MTIHTIRKFLSLFDRYFYGQNTNNVKTIYEKRAEFRNLDISKRLNQVGRFRRKLQDARTTKTS